MTKIALLLSLVFSLVGVRSVHADSCVPIGPHCTQVMINGENCHDRSVNDSNGSYYGPLLQPDGTEVCDAWHGWGDEYSYAAGQQTIANGFDFAASQSIYQANWYGCNAHTTHGVTTGFCYFDSGVLLWYCYGSWANGVWVGGTCTVE